MTDTATVDSEILIRSHTVDLGESLRGFIEREFRRTAKQFFGKVTQAEVHFRQEGGMHVCTASFKVGALPAITARGEHIDIRRAFTDMHRRLGNQLSRLKSSMRQDKPRRDDKAVGFDGNVRATGQRGRYERHLPTERPARLADIAGLSSDEPPDNVSVLPHPDAYDRARTQAAKQGDLRLVSRSASESDIVAYRNQRLPAAAE